MPRRPAEARATFQALCDRVHADIAPKCLRHSNLRPAQAGEILAPSGPAAFTRAFERRHDLTHDQARALAAAARP